MRAPPTRRVLVVDDQGRIRDLIRRALEAIGVEVDEAEDAEQGLRRAEHTAYDVILLDLELGKSEGFSVLQRIASRDRHRAVIVCSGVADPATRLECLSAGAWDFLAKPFSLVDLRARVCSAYGKPPGET